jgi:protein regulator of cytokinesis 1
VKVLCQEIIQLWAELGTPQAQTDTTIVKYHRDAPEQLGLHKEDMAQLKAKKERLVEEKRTRERRLAQLRSTIEDLWERLGVEEHERKQFLNKNRGCGLRTINEYEDELARLNELKRQNLHLFVEEARIKLQELWDALYFSEEEMLDFTPAFSGKFDSYPDRSRLTRPRCLQ